jgi:NAD(P)H-dependent FMN reductase
MRLLLVSGSTRRGSTNAAALHAATELVPEGTEVVLHEDLAALPHFNPDDDGDQLPDAVTALRAEIARADAVVFCTPEYAGTLPGAFKNLLDWTVGGGEMYGKPVAWINVAAPGRGTGADATLRVVLGYLGTKILEASGTRVEVPRNALDEAGAIADPDVRRALADAFAALVAEI